MYQMHNDKMLGFLVKKVGYMSQEKILSFYFSPAGNIFCTFEQEGLNRKNLNFYIIQKQEMEEKDKNLLASMGETFEFRKTAKHDVQAGRFAGEWQENGRFFVQFD